MRPGMRDETWGTRDPAKEKEQKMLRLREKWSPKANMIRTAGQTGAERVYPRRED